MKKYQWQGQTFWLHPHRLMFWEEENILIGSDLHLGKVGHFRKAGIALPQQVFKEDLHRLFAAIQYFQPRQLLIVGDLFHSDANREMDWFLRWRADLPATELLLVKGNHDKLPDSWYATKGIAVCASHVCKTLHFVHDVQDAGSHQAAVNLPRTKTPIRLHLPAQQGCVETATSTATALRKTATISGHIHPGIRLNGFARQSVQLPCFYFTPDQCILPAFSLFTGLYTLHPQASDQVFALLDKEVVEIRKR